MREKVLGLAHFMDPVFPQRLAVIADKIWGIGYGRALAIIKIELKNNVLKVKPNSGKVMYLAEDPQNPETDIIIRKFMDTQDIEKILKILE